MYNSNKFVMVYTLGTSSWRSITVPPYMPHHFSYVDDVPVFMDGSLLWYTEDLTNSKYEVFSFDIHSEELLMIPAPIRGMETQPMFELQGCLCFVCYDRGTTDNDELLVNLYKLKKDDKKHYWDKETIRVPSGGDVVLLQCRIGAVAFINNVLLHWVHQGLLTLYDLHTGTKKVVQVLLDFQVLWCDILNYVENLLSLETFVPPGETEAVYVSYREARGKSQWRTKYGPNLLRESATSCRLLRASAE